MRQIIGLVLVPGTILAVAFGLLMGACTQKSSNYFGDPSILGARIEYCSNRNGLLFKQPGDVKP